jgi:lysophospholipase L1-like esterase
MACTAAVKKLLLVVVSLFLMALLVEGGTRLFLALSGHPLTSRLEFRLTRPPPYKDAAYFSEAFVTEQFRQPGGWHFQKELGFMLPGDMHGQFYNVENHQRRTTGQPVNSEHTVFLIGGSAVYCAEVPDDHTVPSLLQAELTRRFGRRYRVENLGVPGATIREELNRLKTVKLAPGDLVIFYDGANDIIQALFYRNTQGHLVETSDFAKQLPWGTRVAVYVHRKLRKRSLFVRLFLNPFDPTKTPPHLRPGTDLRPLADALRKEYYETVLAAARHTHKAGGRFVHFVQPTLFALSTRSAYESQLLKIPYIVPAGMETAFGVGLPALRAAQRESGRQIESYDAMGLFQARPPGEEYFLDYCHVNHKGNRIVVQFILEKVFADR